MQIGHDYTELWKTILDELKKHVSSSSISLWFSDLRLALVTEKEAIFIARTEFKRDTIIKMHLATMERDVEEVLGYPLKVVILSDENGPVDLSAYERRDTFLKKALGGDEESKAPAPEDGEPDYYATSGEDTLDPDRYHPREGFTFDNFMVGSSNKFAHAAALAVANGVGDEVSQYNPLFIHGPSGLGKTHLLYAITNRVLERKPNTRIIYAKGEEFTNQMVDSIQKRTTDQFRAKFRGVDMLLIDDIQFIAGREGTQEEFFHVFDALYEDGKQIVVASDRPPRDIKLLSDRLVNRFEWGMIADIQPPNFELRCAIARKKAQLMDVEIPDEVITFLCENLTDNVRQLEGALKKTVAYSKLEQQPITVDNVRTWLGDMIGTPVTGVPVDKIISVVAQRYGVTKEDIKSRKKTTDIAAARHKCVYLIHKLSGMSANQIGRKVFSRDHSTIIYSLRSVEFEIENDAAYESEIRDLIEEIRRA